ncbi:NTP transferase domain-containing protein [Maribellus comscasis]|uniref:NTP transferase domain-containing protein n=1 Tax=Maribellus comscasis TaxID=2681766 RepID=A0A6I6JH35_9BACT|nr:nucleotidyltransferase family protein [Maribellus comscasis]QGY42116.1 NTP transferase domain-containing protein [Maribellus comscasis]
MKAMVFAAGLGTRLKDETADKPKALVEIGGKTLLQRTIEKLKKEGVDEIVVNVHHFSEKVKNFIATNNFGIPVSISDESEQLLDTGGGLKKAAPLLKDSDPILIYNVDILSTVNLKELVNYHKKSGALATLTVRDRKTERYLKFDEEKRLVGWLNKKTGETKISVPETFESGIEKTFSGIHVVSPEIFEYFPEDDRFSIIDFYLELSKTQLIKGFFDDSDLWMDVGKPHQLEEARRLFS